MTTPIATAAEPALIDKIGEHMMNAFYFDLSRYLIAATLMFGILVLFKGWANNRRIQNKRAKPADYRREILSSIRTVFFFGLTTISTLLLREAGIIELRLEEFTFSLLFVQTVIIILAHDAYFYWMHRALHHKKLFIATHLHHHKSRTPTPWAAYSFSMWEAMTEAAFVPIFLLVTSLMGVAYAGFAVFLFLWFMIIRNVMGHAGVEIMPAGWVDNKWVQWINTTTHHDLHHSSGNYNFGLYFTWWDRWMGTEHPQYKERFRAVAKPLRIASRPAEMATVIAMSGFATLAAIEGSLGAVIS